MPPAEAVAKTWQQTKSERTRTAILDAAIDCLYQHGYFNTTTESIAREAGVSRGAMLHHFPTRSDLIKATVEHLNRLRLETFTLEEMRVQEGAEHTRVGEGIDSYYAQLNSEPFVVFHELRVAARTDPELAEILRPAHRAYRDALSQASRQIFADLAQSEAYTRTASITSLLLEGMALSKMLDDGDSVPEAMLLEWLKDELRQSYRDVESVSRRREA